MTYIDTAVTPLKPRKEEQMEQGLALLWRLREGGNRSAKTARRKIEEKLGRGAFDRLSDSGLVRVDGSGFLLSSEGAARAVRVTRGRLLAERLLADLLGIRGEALESNACRWEHILSPEAARSICVLLGHPRACPHGEPIPPGPCCAAREKALKPLLRRLDEIEKGEGGRIAYLALDDGSMLHRLLALGLSPGAPVQLKDRTPTCIIQAGPNLIALEPGLAAAVVVAMGPGRHGPQEFLDR